MNDALEDLLSELAEVDTDRMTWTEKQVWFASAGDDPLQRPLEYVQAHLRAGSGEPATARFTRHRVIFYRGDDAAIFERAAVSLRW